MRKASKEFRTDLGRLERRVGQTLEQSHGLRAGRVAEFGVQTKPPFAKRPTHRRPLARRRQRRENLALDAFPKRVEFFRAAQKNQRAVDIALPARLSGERFEERQGAPLASRSLGQRPVVQHAFEERPPVERSGFLRARPVAELLEARDRGVEQNDIAKPTFGEIERKLPSAGGANPIGLRSQSGAKIRQGFLEALAPGGLVALRPERRDEKIPLDRVARPKREERQKVKPFAGAQAR